MNNKEDRRISKTRKAILSAFSELLIEKRELSSVSVKAICDKANVSRGTFYLHYKDVYDLMETFEDELIKQFLETIQMHSTEVLTESLYPFIFDIVTFANKNKDIAIVMLDPDGDSKLGSKIRDALKRQSMLNIHAIDPAKVDDSMEYYYDFVFGGSLAVIFHWYKHQHEQTTEEIARIIERIITDGVNFLK